MVELMVSGMTCGHCARAVTSAVGAVPGAGTVTVDLRRGLVRVEGTPDPAAVRTAILEEGYAIAAAAA